MTEKNLSRKSPYPWWMGVLIGIDQLGNAIAGGDPDETISSRIGRRKVKSGGKLNWRRNPLHWLLDVCLEKVDKNHTVDAIGS